MKNSKKLAAQPLPNICNTHYMLTNRGLMDCRVAEFDSSNQHGINYNTRKKNKSRKST
jgi:hypothetical protein